jgi:hypothetical protein
MGLSTSIYVAAIEMAGPRRKLKEILDEPVEPQFLICIGKMEPTDPRYTLRNDLTRRDLVP